MGVKFRQFIDFAQKNAHDDEGFPQTSLALN
jgi:hypothetical protein